MPSPHVNLPRIVAPADAPDYIQHLTTDINDVINRINSVLTTVIVEVDGGDSGPDITPDPRAWVSTDENGTRALLDLDFENKRYWYNNKLYTSFTDVATAVGAGSDNGDGTYTLGPVNNLPFAGYNPAAGTIINEYINLSDEIGRYAYAFQQPGADSNYIRAATITNNHWRSFGVNRGGIIQANLTTDALIAHQTGIRCRFCDVYAENDFSMHIDGEFIAADTSGLVSAAATGVQLMIGHVGNSSKLFGIMFRFAYFPRAVGSAGRTKLSYRSPSTTATNGGRVWFSTPYSVLLGGTKQLTGGVGSFTGGILAGSVGGIPDVLSSTIAPRDDHNSPAFLRLADGRIMTHYQGHTLPQHYQRITDNVPDEDNPPIWGPEVDLHPYLLASNNSYAYSALCQMGNGDIYCFLRCRHTTAGTLWWTWHYSISTDLGATWTPVQVLFTAAANVRSYTRIWKTSPRRIDLACNDGSPAEYPPQNSQYHCYLDTVEGKFYSSDGVDLGPPPFVPTYDLTRVYDGRLPLAAASSPAAGMQRDWYNPPGVNPEGSGAWIWDIKADRSGNPIIVFTEITFRWAHRYWYARWTGTQWEKERICAQGATLYPNTDASELWYSGGIVIDPDDTDVIYCSRETGGDIGATSTTNFVNTVPSGDGYVNTTHYNYGTFQLWRGRRVGKGIWHMEQLTFGSEDCMRPDRISGAPLTYSVGTYPNYFNYQLRIEELPGTVIPVPPPTPIGYLPGYQALIYYDFPTDYLTEYRATYKVPTAPAELPWGGHNLYCFISSQDAFFGAGGHDLVLLQPVLQYGSFGDANNPEFGGDFWVIANWIRTSQTYYISDAVTVVPGATLTAKIKRNGAGDYTVSVEEYPAIDLHMTGLPYEQRWVSASFESYGITDWGQNPGALDIQILNLDLATGGADVTVPFVIYPSTKSETAITLTDNGTPTPLVHILPKR